MNKFSFLRPPLNIVSPSNRRQPVLRPGAGPNCALEPGKIPPFNAIFRRFRPVSTTATLGNRSMRCSTSCVHAVVPRRRCRNHCLRG